MRLNLLTKNKLGFIDGTVKHDDLTKESEKQYWDCCNVIVISEL